MAGEYIPSNVNTIEFYERGEKITSNNPIETSFTRKGTTLDIKYINEKNDTYLELPLLYYKGYKASDNSKIEKGTNGMVRLYAQNGTNEVKVSYELTTIRKISYIISIISLLAFMIIKNEKIKKIG